MSTAGASTDAANTDSVNTNDVNTVGVSKDGVSVDDLATAREDTDRVTRVERHMSDPAPVQFLTPDGEWNPSDTAGEFADELDGLSVDDFRTWYSDMVHTRAFDIECTNLQRQGQLALWVQGIGQEGCQVGLANACIPEDFIVPSYREHTVARVRGLHLTKLAAVFRGLTHGGWDINDPANGNMNLYTLVLGAQTQHAAGYALGQLLDAKAKAGDTTLDPGQPGMASDAATMVFYGDGTTSQGDPNEAMIFAASYQSPLVFVVQNNKWAISVPVTRQSRTPLYRRALGFGIDSVQIDGNDPLAAYAVGKRFMDDARAGNGPRAIEALTYRIGAHTTSDDPTRYRENEELEEWQLKDPIQRFEHFLRGKGVGDDFFEETETAAKAHARKIRDEILALPAPTPESMFENVYSDAHPRMNEQVDWLQRYESSFTEDEATPVEDA